MSGAGVVLFHTSSAALRAEKILSTAGITVKLVPTPRELSSDCGVALCFTDVTGRCVAALLESHCVEFASLHYPYPPHECC